MIVYLNGEYLPAEEARISPLDRGFLFGDGIYEFIPSYDGRCVALGLHLQRMNNGLAAIGIENPLEEDDWAQVARELGLRNGGGDLGIYMHVSRGNEGIRSHRFPEQVPPTAFAMVVDIDPHPEVPDRGSQRGLKAITAPDLRWRRCNIKSTALLGNVLHYQQGFEGGVDETILYNERGEITEASASNVFIVSGGVVATPELDQQKLPGISRHIVLAALRSEGTLAVEERVVTLAELQQAEEVWITNSSQHISPVVELDGRMVGDGRVGATWERAMRIYEDVKYSF